MSEQQSSKYRLPFSGRWFVGAAGDTLNVNHHMECPSQWYGMDFVKVGGPNCNELNRESGIKNEEYFSWNEPVFSPVKGKIRFILDQVEDNKLGKRNEDQAFGNYVVIEDTHERFVYIAHFKKDSIIVEQGQDIKLGQKLGNCGNSGNSDCPHIHMHVQNKFEPYNGEGQRIVFSGINVVMVGKLFEFVEWPLITGLFVEQAPDV